MCFLVCCLNLCRLLHALQLNWLMYMNWLVYEVAFNFLQPVLAITNRNLLSVNPIRGRDCSVIE